MIFVCCELEILFFLIILEIVFMYCYMSYLMEDK